MKRRSSLPVFAVIVMVALPALLWVAKLQVSLPWEDGAKEKISTDYVRMEESLAAGPVRTAAQETLDRMTERGASFAGGLSDANAPGGGADPTSGRTEMPEYAYSQLSQDGKRLYREILDAITRFSEDVELSVRDTSAVGDVMECVMADHPEIFYVDGYSCTTHTMGDAVVKITFSARYTLNENQIEERKVLIDTCVRKILAGMDVTADDYGKLKYLYDYLIRNTDYDLDAPENQTICSVFLYGRSVCQGYAKAFQLLCMRAGIPSVLVTGTVADGEGHAWNLVQADGEWYYTDPTWGDARYRMTDSDPAWRSEKVPEVNYDYFLVTTQQLLRTHRISPLFRLPECTSMADNHYVRQGAYFTDVDGEKIARLFQAAYEQGEEMVTLKCADGEIYGSIRKRLLDDQEIFRYLEGSDTSVAYIDSQEQLSLSFWLR